MTERRLRPCPDLSELIVRHGGYSQIPADAWAAFDAAVAAWKHMLREDQLRVEVVKPRRKLTPQMVPSSATDDCYTCKKFAPFGYRNRVGRLTYFCKEHRLAEHYADGKLTEKTDKKQWRKK